MEINEINKQLYESAFIQNGEYGYHDNNTWNPSINEREIETMCCGDFIKRKNSKSIYKVTNITTRGISVIYNDNKNNLLNFFIPTTYLVNFSSVNFDYVDSFSSLNQSKDDFIKTVNEYKKYLTI